MHVPRRTAICSVLVFVVAACGVLPSCGEGDTEPSRPADRWRVEPTHADARHLTPADRAVVERIALSEVKWTGEAAPAAHDDTVFAVTVTAAGQVHFGDRTVQPKASGAEGGLRELQAWWASARGRSDTVWEDSSPVRIETYVDRAVSWDRVRSVLAFLAAQPHSASEVWLAVARTERGRNTAYLHGRLGRPKSLGGMITEGVSLPPDHDWREGLRADMRELPPMRWSGPYQRYVGGGIDYWIMIEGDGFLGDDVRVRRHVFRPSRPLEEPRVVSAANAWWAQVEAEKLFEPRQRDPEELRVWSGGDWERDEPADSRPAVVHVPAAYVFAYIDLCHASARGVRTELLGDGVLCLDLPPPAGMLPPPPRAVWPFGVVIACVLVGALCVAAVASRPRLSRRACTCRSA